MWQKMLQVGSGGGTPFRKDESQSGTKTGNGTIDITMAEDGIFLSTVVLSYSSSGSIRMSKNGTQIFNVTTRATYPLFQVLKKGDTLQFYQNTSGKNDYAVYYGDISFFDM